MDAGYHYPIPRKSISCVINTADMVPATSPQTKLSKKHCVPCEGNTPPLSAKQIRTLSVQLNTAWTIADNQIRRVWKLPDFQHAMKFVNHVAKLAEQENHHPDIHILYNKVTLELTTHAIHSLSENDFILAAKIDAINPP